MNYDELQQLINRLDNARRKTGQLYGWNEPITTDMAGLLSEVREVMPFRDPWSGAVLQPAVRDGLEWLPALERPEEPSKPLIPQTEVTTPVKPKTACRGNLGGTPNKYPGTCAKCRRHVTEESGVVVPTNSGYRIYC